MRDQTATSVPEFRVKISGTDRPEITAVTTAVSVHQDLWSPSMFSLRLLDAGATTLESTLADDDLFALGNKVEIEMGYMGETETVIAGEITGLEPEYSTEEAQGLLVRGHDQLHRLTRGRKTRSFVDMSLKDIVGTIAGDSALSPKTGPGAAKVKLDYVLQNNQTDLEFIHTHAARIGYQVFVIDKDLYFDAPELSRGEKLTLSPDQDLIEFYPRLSAMSQIDKLTVRGWDPRKKEKIAGEARSVWSKMGDTTGPDAAKKAFGSSEAVRTQSPLFSKSEADEVAKGCFDEMALAYISGEGVCIGRTDLRAGIVVGVKGLGQRFSGSYYVTSTTHSVTSTNGYRTAFTVRRNAT